MKLQKRNIDIILMGGCKKELQKIDKILMGGEFFFKVGCLLKKKVK